MENAREMRRPMMVHDRLLIKARELEIRRWSPTDLLALLMLMVARMRDGREGKGQRR
uniref:Uncharacterized protein n=1 Tax=Oryza sativa subsp. japonica TaxID=39947 RepID=Q6ETA9_ORYSJ|nr:hypothetical protein [Oryza sativa Japonica Group]